jgi:ligand-binding SRPBCC domain-containing protein
MPLFERSLDLPLSAAEAFHLHERPDILGLLSPPWEHITVVQPPASLREGTRVVIRMKLGPLSLTWTARHTRYEPPLLFEDVQEKGPFSKWIHQHRFADLPGDGPRCRLTDHIEYALLPPLLAPVAWVGDALVVRRRLDRMFAWRHERTAQLARELVAARQTA